jgi:hypothetical protein
MTGVFPLAWAVNPSLVGASLAGLAASLTTPVVKPSRNVCTSGDLCGGSLHNGCHDRSGPVTPATRALRLSQLIGDKLASEALATHAANLFERADAMERENMGPAADPAASQPAQQGQESSLRNLTTCRMLSGKID